MTIKGKSYLVGAYEHPLRKAPNHSVAQLHAEVAKGALDDAGLTKNDIDGYFCAGDAPGANVWSMANYMNLNKLRHVDSTDMGGTSYLVHVAHAAEAIAAGKCNVAQVVSSPMISDPLHRLDCCVVSDGGGAVIVARPEVAKSLKRPLVKLIGAGESTKG